MRNAGLTPDCGCGPVIGEIRHGKKYPFGTVTVEMLRSALNEVNAELERLSNYCNSLNTKNTVNEANIESNKENINNNRTEISKINCMLVQIRENIMALMSSIDKVDTKVNATAEEMKSYSDTLNNLRDSLSIISSNVSAINTKTDLLDARVSVLENVKPEIKINSFAVSPKTAEMGSVVNANLTWTLSRDETTATLNGMSVKGLRSYNATNVTANTEYKLIVTDEKERTATSTVKIEFLNSIIYGASQDETAAANTLKNLATKTLSNTVSRTINVNTGEGMYIYYCYPKRLGQVKFFTGGIFEGGFEEPVVISYSNNAGYTEEYYAYRSSYMFPGETEVQIVKA